MLLYNEDTYCLVSVVHDNCYYLHLISLFVIFYGKSTFLFKNLFLNFFNVVCANLCVRDDVMNVM